MWTVLLALSSQASALEPRAALPAVDIVVPPIPDTVVGRLQVSLKFVDAARARALADGRLQWTGDVDAAQVQSFEGLSTELRFKQRIHLSAQALGALEGRAAQQSGRAQPDLAGIVDVTPTEAMSPPELGSLARMLQAHPLVEHAFVRPIGTPPPGDIAPETDDFTDCQTYRPGTPGIDADFAQRMGATGSNVRLSDCEYGWEYSHEDLVDKDLHPEEGQTVPDWVIENRYDAHGTSAIGMNVAVDNGYGVTGIVPDATVYTWPEYSDEEESRRLTAIASAIAASDHGDVVLLEMQIGVVCTSCYGPAELDPDVWATVRAGVDAGVVVVGAAGNGAQDLDEGWYADNYMLWGDSGAIIVGAGSADERHATLYFSGFGERVDVQGWGERVCTTGYGDYALVGGDPNQAYTSSFAGTSSGSAMVAGIAVAVQDYAIAHRGTPLSPSLLRDLLVDTGHPGTGDPIGPLPDIRAAILRLDGDLDGHLHTDFGGDDCDDADAAAFPGGEEVWYDGIDGDCDGGDDFDQDGDGHASIDHDGDDCDDTDATVNPVDTPEVTCTPSPDSGDPDSGVELGGSSGGGGDGKQATCGGVTGSAGWLSTLVMALATAVRRRKNP